jgi:predicted ATPase
LKIITTSRIALKIQSEREYPVPPLEMPQRESTLEELAGYESIKLFVERARAAQPNFALTKDNATSVSEICLRVDGLPLALELAAARIKLLSPQAILSRLDDQLKLLTGGARDLPSRQQTLRNTLEWSYNLLNDDEKKLYARLSVFVGGFTLEAAEAVCNAENKFDTLEGLTALVDNSLLRQEEVNGEPRFGMLETIRAYAVERLAQSGETPVLHASHAQFFGNIILNQAGYEIYSSNAWRWLNWFEHELDNIRATLNWSLTTPQGIQLGVGLISMLFWFWYRRGHFIEGKQWAEKFLEVPNVQNTPAMRAAALASSGMMALWQGQQETALAKLEATLAIEQQLEDDRMVATSQMATGIAFINMGRDGDAKPLLEEASQFFEVNNPYFHGLTLVHLGNAELGLGHPDKAYAYHSKAETAARQINENWLLSFALNNLGEVARTMGQYDLARKYYEECETLLPDSGDKGDRARFVHNLGYIAQHEGDYERAESQFRRSLKMFRQLGNRRGMAECMAGLAGLKAHQGQVEWGAVMLSAADSVLKATGGAWWPADRVEVEATQEFIRSALDEAEWNGAQKTGRAMTLEEALGFASETE